MSFTLTPALLDAQASGESGGNPLIGYHDPSRSTASGAFGFLDSTWQGLMQKHPELGLTMANKNDPATQRRAYQVFASDNANTLQGMGVNPDASTVSLASFLGPQAAAAFAKSDPNASAASVLVQAVGPAMASKMMQSNPEILGPSAKVADVIAHNNKTHVDPSLGGTGMGTPTGPNMPPLPPQPTLPDAPQARGPSEAAQAPGPPAGSDSIAMGLAMMGGAPTNDGFKDAGQAYQSVLARQQALGIQNANFKNDAITRDWAEPYKSFDAAEKIAALRASMRGQDITADTARGDTQVRADATMESARLRQMYMNQWHEQQATLNKSTERYVVPGSDPTTDQPVIVTMSRDGTRQVLDGRTMQPVPNNTLPDGAIPDADFRKSLDENRKTNNPLITKMAQDASAGRDQDERFTAAMNAFNAPGANTRPGIMGNIGRALDATFGTNVFGNLADTQIAEGLIKQDNLGQFGKASGGGQRVTDALRSYIEVAQAHFGQHPDAVNGITGFVQHQNAMRFRLNDAWNQLSPEERENIKNRGNVAQWSDKTRKGFMDQDIADLKAAQADLEQRYGPSGNPGPGGVSAKSATPATSNRPPLDAIPRIGAQEQAPAGPQAPPGFNMAPGVTP